MANNEFGDFQTPLPLARRCVKVLGIASGARILEPTCGRGAFLEAVAELVPRSERLGLEINDDYVAEASHWGKVRQGNVFEVSLPDVVGSSSGGQLYIIGNPPWVTSAELKRMDSKNLPSKENFKRVGGLDALLGGSNFDVCEYIILKALKEFSDEKLSLGMLCKTQVARNVIEYAASIELPVEEAAIYRIDAMKWFGAGVDACWFTVTLTPDLAQPDYTAKVFEDLFSSEGGPSRRFGMVGSRLVSDVDKYSQVRAADGACPYTWRSGLKHDASSVFELVAAPEPATKSGVLLDLEPDYVFPFLKSTDIFRGRHRKLTKWVIVPQMEFGTDTSGLRVIAPKLWAYLEANAQKLDGRKSSVYKNRPRFCVFGHGPYTFAPYKVAVSGLHKDPVFRLVTPMDDQPVVLDDTCYMLPFEDPTEAAVVTTILNSESCMALIDSLVFRDSKRPITKKLLARLDLNRLPVESLSIVSEAHALAHDLDLDFDERRASCLIGHLGDPEDRQMALF